MNILPRSGPLQRAASRLAHALSLLWLTSSAPAPFAATGIPAAALPESSDTAIESDPAKEISHEHGS